MELDTAGAPLKGWTVKLDQEELIGFPVTETGINILVKSQDMVQICCVVTDAKK